MGSEKFLIDTESIIDYLRGQSKAITSLNKMLESHECYISTMTIAELYSGVREGKERQMLDDFFQLFQILPVDNTIAQRAGLWRREYGKSHGTGLADCIIAATADEINAVLVTFNKKQFPMIKRIKALFAK